MDVKRSIQKALDHIEAHLKEQLLLEDIADVANYSPWHFHRMFLAATGFGVGEYIRKRRMSEASRELAYSDKPIKCVASDYLFESQAAFTRAFKAYSGVTPGKLRQLFGPLISFRPIVLHATTKGEIMIKHSIRHKDAFILVGMSTQTTMKNNVIPQLWLSFNYECKKIQNTIHKNTCLGICLADPSVEMNDDTPFTYIAGMEVSDGDQIPEGMLLHEVPAADYAVFEHIGSLETLDKTYATIYGEWFPQSEFSPQHGFDFELYDERFRYGAPDSIMEIWVPVKKN